MLRRIEMLLLDLAVFAVAALGLLITASVVLRVTVNSGVPASRRSTTGIDALPMCAGVAASA